jgi:hypothetical protein
VTRATAAAGTAVVLAEVAIAATTAAAPRDGGTIAGARLVSDIRSALDAAAAGDDIIQVRIQNRLAEAWYYQNSREILTRSEIFSASGQPGFDQGYAATSTSVTYTSVSYAAKTWSTSTVQADKLRPPGPARPARHLPRGYLPGPHAGPRHADLRHSRGAQPRPAHQGRHRGHQRRQRDQTGRRRN